MNELLVFAEQHGKRISEPCLELLEKGRQLAEKAGSKLSSVLLGYQVREITGELVAYGSDKVYLFEHEELRDYRILPYARIITNLIRKEEPVIVLFAATTTGRELAPRIAARLETGLTADCTDLDVGDYEDECGRLYRNILIQIRPAFGGDVIATIVTPKHRPQMATVRPGMFSLPEKDVNRSGEVIVCDAEIKEEDRITTITDSVKTTRKIDLKTARVIVAGGRGARPEGFGLIKRLADVLGAEVGASRAAVNAGWISYDHQIGLSGQTVKPDVYVACGISGTIQHLVGMKNSKTIIAINKDRDAQIFKFAHYGIVGDLSRIIPKLIETLS